MPDELEKLMGALGEPRYRAAQLIRWIYARYVSDFEQMTDLSKKFRALLQEHCVVPELALQIKQESAEQNTDKYLFRLPDGSFVESVRMRYVEAETASEDASGKGRIAICISSQVGCAMACSFCASGLDGLKRNLARWEIVDQVLQIQKHVSKNGERVANVVFMGIGEPLHNYDNVLSAIRMINLQDGLGIGMRHLCISTSGLVPQIRQLAQERLPIRLAISLHAPTDSLRNEIMPVNKRWPLPELLSACREYQAMTDRRITFEYVLLDGVNDALPEAEALGELLQGFRALVNLIPWNPVEGAGFSRSRPARVRAFQRKVEEYGLKCTVRQEKGSDIEAACGQLRLQE
ncbi:unnamed protein product, partial [Phaeothamnion confervicola]